MLVELLAADLVVIFSHWNIKIALIHLIRRSVRGILSLAVGLRLKVLQHWSALADAI